MLIRPVYRPRMPSLSLGLVAWWPFDDSKAYDYSGNRYNGTPNNSPVPVGGRAPGVGGRLPGALKFNGSTQDITLPSSLAVGPPLTATAWVNTSSTSAQTILWMEISSTSWGIFIDGSNNWDFEKGAVVDIASGITPVLNTWQHIAWVVGSDNKPILYVNGVKVFSSSDASAFINTNRNNTIGSNGGSTPFTGMLDDIRVYNRALSSGEVLALYVEAFQPQIDIETIALMKIASSAVKPWPPFQLRAA